MSIIKLIATVILAVAIITTITSIQLPIYASPTTEDDGWTDGDYEGSSEEQEEQAQEDWEDAGRPGDDNNDDDDGDGDDDSNSNTDDDLPLCRWGVKEDCMPKNGSTPCLVKDSADPCMDIWGGFSGETTAEFSKRVGKIVESSTYPGNDDDGPNPYCDKVGPNYRGVCHDRKDYSESTGLYPCNDGTQKTDWRDCNDATKKNNDNDNDGRDKTVVIKPPQLSQPQILSIRTCEQIGTSDGDALMFNLEIYKICGDNYTNSFISGCEQGYKDLGFVFVRCERVVEANINR